MVETKECLLKAPGGFAEAGLFFISTRYYIFRSARYFLVHCVAGHAWHSHDEELIASIGKRWLCLDARKTFLVFYASSFEWMPSEMVDALERSD
jgi:hypothetical protein